MSTWSISDAEYGAIGQFQRDVASFAAALTGRSSYSSISHLLSNYGVNAVGSQGDVFRALAGAMGAYYSRAVKPVSSALQKLQASGIVYEASDVDAHATNSLDPLVSFAERISRGGDSSAGAASAYAAVMAGRTGISPFLNASQSLARLDDVIKLLQPDNSQISIRALATACQNLYASGIAFSTDGATVTASTSDEALGANTHRKTGNSVKILPTAAASYALAHHATRDHSFVLSIATHTTQVVTVAVGNDFANRKTVHVHTGTTAYTASTASLHLPAGARIYVTFSAAVSTDITFLSTIASGGPESTVKSLLSTGVNLVPLLTLDEISALEDLGLVINDVFIKESWGSALVGPSRELGSALAGIDQHLATSMNVPLATAVKPTFWVSMGSRTLPANVSHPSVASSFDKFWQLMDICALVAKSDSAICQSRFVQ